MSEEYIKTMRGSKGIAEITLLWILGFTGLWVWRLMTYQPNISCEQYRKNLKDGKENKGIDIKDHFYHSHKP